MDNNTATCPVCKRSVKITKTGKLARHGYKQGLGSYRQQIGTGSCIGSSNTIADLPNKIAIDHNYNRKMAAREDNARHQTESYTRQASNARAWLVSNGYEALANDETLVPSWW